MLRRQLDLVGPGESLDGGHGGLAHEILDLEAHDGLQVGDHQLVTAAPRQEAGRRANAIVQLDIGDVVSVLGEEDRKGGGRCHDLIQSV